MSGNAVLFVNDVARMTAFYSAVVPMERVYDDAQHAVLRSGTFELVVHALPAEVVNAWPVAVPPALREDSYVKLAFTVRSLDLVRERIVDLGGTLRAQDAEFLARGYRVCDGSDPEGNVIQFRERAASG
jgi:catechol 2,3-dioxygenase-like lactoylglutathione lyase family enzyme